MFKKKKRSVKEKYNSTGKKQDNEKQKWTLKTQQFYILTLQIADFPDFKK